MIDTILRHKFYGKLRNNLFFYKQGELDYFRIFLGILQIIGPNGKEYNHVLFRKFALYKNSYRKNFKSIKFNKSVYCIELDVVKYWVAMVKWLDSKDNWFLN